MMMSVYLVSMVSIESAASSSIEINLHQHPVNTRSLSIQAYSAQSPPGCWFFTWNDSEPGRLMGISNWISCQTGVLSCILHGDFRQVEHLHIGHVQTASLCNTHSEETHEPPEQHKCFMFGMFPEGYYFFLALPKTNLEYLNIGCSIRAVAGPISFYVFEPLNVRLGIAVDLTV